jgi:hypothetical protein
VTLPPLPPAPAAAARPAAPPLPPAPRPLTARVSFRIWIDPRVRFWWLIAAVLLLLATYFSIERIYEWKLDSDLIRSGTPVLATVGVEGVPRPGYVAPAGTPLTLTFELNGQEHQVVGTLEGQSTQVATAQKVPLRIDPNDLTRWTDLTEPRPIGGYLIVPVMILPIAAAALAAAGWIRRRLVRVWQKGNAVEALLVDRHQTALAPMSQVIRCTLPGRSDKRLLVAYLPRQPQRLQRGEPVWLIHGATKGEPVLAAAWLQ